MRLAVDLAIRIGCVLLTAGSMIGVGYITCSTARENRDHLARATAPVVVLPAAQIQAMGCLTMGLPYVHQTIDAVVDRTVPRVYVSDKLDRTVPHDTMMGRCGGTLVIVRAYH